MSTDSNNVQRNPETVNAEQKHVDDVQQLLDCLASARKTSLPQSVCEDNFSFDATDLVLFRIDKITFEEDAPHQAAMENVLASMRVPGVNFVYLIEGNDNGVNVYVGIARDTTSTDNVATGVKDIGDSILKSSILGNYRGSEISRLSPEELKMLMSRLKERKHSAVIEGVPGVTETKDNKSFQGIDRLVDVMSGDTFLMMILAKPVTTIEAQRNIYRELCSLYNLLSPSAKQNRQQGESKETSVTAGSSKQMSVSEEARKITNTGENKTETTSVSKNKSHNETTRETTTVSVDSVDSDITKGFDTNSSGGEHKSNGKTRETIKDGYTKHTTNVKIKEVLDSPQATTVSETANTEKTKSTSESSSQTTGATDSTNRSTTHTQHTHSGATAEFVNKEAQEWLKYLDEVLLPRLDYANGKGLFVVSSCIMADNPKVLLKLGNTVRSIFSGTKGNRIPLYATNLTNGSTVLERFRKFQISYYECPQISSLHERAALYAKSQCTLPVKSVGDGSEKLFNGRWMSSAELATMAGVPQKEIVGLKLKEEVEFGFNVAVPGKADDIIKIGTLIQNGSERGNIPVTFSKKDMDRHIFVAGVTGGGKTITCKKLLHESGMPFLVIEPAKTEYRSLKNSLCPDLLVFSLGNENVAPFRLNPFEFLPGENITSRVDMIKATIEASFDMEAAIPQIIEQAIYACYEDKGWDINTNENSQYPNPFADEVFAFPTLSDMIDKCREVVEKMGFDERLKSDYIGSIVARLNGLIVGAKGSMLNCRRSMDFRKLLDKKVVLELEEIRSGSEKSLVMGFIITNLLEAIKQLFKSNGNSKHYHITLIEEAHRLLSRYEAGDSLNKKHGVETFADMLAEIRKYGESLIIADQIPDKMTPEVLKNTNTKIIHRLFAQDDKDAIGSTMMLTEKQRNFLSNLKVGRAIMYTGNWDKAVQVQVDMIKESEEFVDETLLRRGALEFYIQDSRRGIVDSSECFGDQPPTLAEMEDLMKYNSLCWKEFKLLLENSRITAGDIPHLIGPIAEKIGASLFPTLIRQFFGKQSVNVDSKMQMLYEIIDAVLNNRVIDPDLRQKFKAGD